METNYISILDIPPRYSNDHIEIIKTRVKKAFPNFNQDALESFICNLYGVKSLTEIKHGGFLEYQEKEPALSSVELRIMSNRVREFCDDDFKRKESVKNILNSVPKTVADLEDYITEKERNDIKKLFLTSYLIMEDVAQDIDVTKFSNQSFEEAAKLFNQLDFESMGNIGAVVMELVQTTGGGITETDTKTQRQELLLRGGQYLVMHQLNYKVASLWLAEHISSPRWGKPNDCYNANHFGFYDNEASIELVLGSANYIMHLHNQLEDDSNCNKHIIQPIYEAYLNQTAFCIQQIFYCDQTRVREKDIEALFAIINNDTNYEHYEYRTFIEALKVTYIFLYEKDQDKETITRFFKQVLFFNDYLQKHKNIKPNPDFFAIYDMLNFYAIATNYELPLEHNSFTLVMDFLLSQYSGQTCYEFSNTLKLMLDIENINKIPEQIFTGYLTNFLNLLRHRHMENDNFLTFIYFAIEDYPRSSFIIKRMAEHGHLLSMVNQYENTSSKEEQSYWQQRIDLLT